MVNYCYNALIQYYNIISKLFQYVSCRYHSSILLLIKKSLIKWGIIPISCLKSMSDNIHYVNLMPYKPLVSLLVGDNSYLRIIRRKIKRVGGYFKNPRHTVPKKTKSLISQHIWKEKIKKGLRHANA